VGRARGWDTLLGRAKARAPAEAAPSAEAALEAAREELTQILGLLITMAVIFGLVAVLWQDVNILYLPLVLVLTVATASFLGGVKQGLLSAGLACVFLWFYLYAYRHSVLEWIGSGMIWTAVLGGVAGLTGYLQRRAREQSFKPWHGNVAPFQAASESLPGLAIILLNREGRVTTWNSGAETLFGWTAAETIGQSLDCCCDAHAAPAGAPLAALKHAAAKGRFTGEWRCVNKAGTTFHCAVTIRVLLDERGREAGYTLSAQDLSEREAAAAALLQRAHQQVAIAALSQAALEGAALDSLCDQAVSFIMQTWKVDSCGVFELQEDGRTLLLRSGSGMQQSSPGPLSADLNPSSLFTYVIGSPETVVLKDLPSITRFEVPGFLKELGVISSVMAAIPGHPLPYGILTANTRVQAEFAPEDLSFLQAVAGVLATARARKTAEESMAKLASFALNNPNPIFEFARNGSLTYANAAATRLARALELADPSQLLPAGTPEIVRECLDTGTPRLALETRIRNRTLRWWFHPIAGTDLVQLHALDLTEQLNLEAQLRQSQKLEAIGQLATGVAHDFNNILTVMKGFASRLAGQQSPARPGEEVQEILNATDRAAALTRQLLAFSRRQEFQPRPVDLRRVVTSMTRMLDRIIGESIRLEVTHPEVLPLAAADPSMMEQVLLNLVVNARDAMPQGGALAVGASAVSLDPDSAARRPQARPGQFVCLEVRDSGCGMDEKTLARIFDPFFTTKGPGKGTGLGLATVNGIVQQHKGWIEVESAVGRGTVFRVFLPVTTEPAQEAQETPQTLEPLRGGSESILVAEDEPLLRMLARSTLEPLGYKVFEAGDGPEAEAIWTAQEGRIDLLLTDQVMPGGMTGRELAARLQAAQPGLKVILCSGYGGDTPEGGPAAHPEMAFLQKPYPPAQMARLVRRCLDGPEPAPLRAAIGREESAPPTSWGPG